MKKKIKVMLVLWIIGILLGIAPVSANAAKLIHLNPNMTHKSYDFTRDGKADKFKYTMDYSQGITKLYLNGKYKQKIFSARGSNLSWCMISKKNTFLLQNIAQYGGNNLVAFKYTGGRFKKVCELDDASFTFKAFDGIEDNILYVSSYPRSFHTKSFENMGDRVLKSTVKYKLANGKFKLVSRKADATGDKIFYSRQSFRTSANADKLGKKNGPSVKKGQKVTLKKIYFLKKGGYVYGIKVGNKMGWFKDSEKRQFTLKK